MKTSHHVQKQLYTLWLTPESQEEHNVLARLESLISHRLECYFEMSGQRESLMIELPSPRRKGEISSGSRN